MNFVYNGVPMCQILKSSTKKFLKFMRMTNECHYLVVHCLLFYIIALSENNVLVLIEYTRSKKIPNPSWI